MIHLRKLRLSGPTSHYDVDFDARESNLAIIAGQIFTGKTTILGFVDYCLGNNEHPTHPEIAKRARTVALEIAIDGNSWTIERPIFSSEQLAWIHEGGVDDTNSPTSRKNIESPSDPDSLSAWLVQISGLEGLRLKVTPGNPNSPAHLLSFRDLMWLCYLPHRRLDNEALLFEDHQFKGPKLQQVIEVLFDVADQRLTDLLSQLNVLRVEHRAQAGEIRFLHAFLQENGTPERAEIESQRVETAAQREVIGQELTRIERDMSDATGYAQQLRVSYSDARKRLRTAITHQRDREVLIERLLPLRGQYAEDERKLTFVGEARRLFDPLHVLACPACMQKLPSPPSVVDAQCTLCGQELKAEGDAGFDVELERKALRERTRDLDRYIDQVREEASAASRAVQETRLEEERVEAELNSRVASDLGPFVHARENFVRTIEQLDARDAALKRALAMHEGLERRESELGALEARQTAVRKELDQRRENRPDKAEVVADLSASFADLLRSWEFPKVDEGEAPKLDENFVPWVRGRPYREVGSAGAMTLIAVAWQLTLFERAIEEGLQHPGFLMIDSPEKNLSPDKVGDTDFLDPKIVERMWTHMERWCENHPGAQLVIVENTPPPLVDDNVIIRFSRDPGVPPYGLITDETG
jgi:hypothetical protein